MSQNMRHIMMGAVLLVATVLGAWGGNVTFKAKLDSVTLLMGKTTALHLEITQDKNARGFFPGEQADTLLPTLPTWATTASKSIATSSSRALTQVCGSSSPSPM